LRLFEILLVLAALSWWDILLSRHSLDDDILWTLNIE